MSTEEQKTKLYSFGIIPIVITGLVDGINPCIFSAIVLLLLYMSDVGKSYAHLKKAGVYFIAGFVVATYLFLVSYDRLMAPTAAQVALYNAQMVLGIILILIGMVSFYDWLMFRQHQDLSRFVIRFPSVFENPNSEPPSKKLRKLVWLSLLWGFFVGWMASAWPPSSSLALQYTELFLPGKMLKNLLIFALYALCIIMPLIIAYMSILCLAKLSRKSLDIKKYASIVKIVNSAVNIGLGVGLIYIFY